MGLKIAEIALIEIRNFIALIFVLSVPVILHITVPVMETVGELAITVN